MFNISSDPTCLNTLSDLVSAMKDGSLSTGPVEFEIAVLIQGYHSVETLPLYLHFLAMPNRSLQKHIPLKDANSFSSFLS